MMVGKCLPCGEGKGGTGSTHLGLPLMAHMDLSEQGYSGLWCDSFMRKVLWEGRC